jgi:hypothetical protein
MNFSPWFPFIHTNSKMAIESRTELKFEITKQGLRSEPFKKISQGLFYLRFPFPTIWCQVANFYYVHIYKYLASTRKNIIRPLIAPSIPSSD